MGHKTITTEKEYEIALERFERVFLSEGTSESDEADVLALMIKEYEDKHYKINK